MIKNMLAVVLLSGVVLPAVLTGCQRSAEITENAASGTVRTEAEARAAVGRYLQNQPNQALYLLDSAAVVDADASYQVLVPRTDWAGRMPNKAAFNVSKTTGAVTIQAVK